MEELKAELKECCADLSVAEIETAILESGAPVDDPLAVAAFLKKHSS